MGQQQLCKTNTKLKKEIIQTKVDHTIIIILLGTGEVGKSTILKRIEYLFPDEYTNYLTQHCNCKLDVLVHFKSVLRNFNKIRPTYDDKTEEILEKLMQNPDYIEVSQWNSEYANVICEISKEEKFQNILSSRHLNEIGDSADYMLKRAKYFDTEPTTRMDELRFDLELTNKIILENTGRQRENQN
jgi:energy-coupling factor transporter ATP-binding protein EcfA2